MDAIGHIELLEDTLEEKYDVVIRLSYKKNIHGIKVNEIIVPPSVRGKGVGTKVFDELSNFADRFKMNIVLTPSTELGASSIDRLNKFYKKFNFVKNEFGKSQDTMIRYPI